MISKNETPTAYVRGIATQNPKQYYQSPNHHRTFTPNFPNRHSHQNNIQNPKINPFHFNNAQIQGNHTIRQYTPHNKNTNYNNNQANSQTATPPNRSLARFKPTSRVEEYRREEQPFASKNEQVIINEDWSHTVEETHIPSRSYNENQKINNQPQNYQGQRTFRPQSSQY
jgi:hypothetical protein